MAQQQARPTTALVQLQRTSDGERDHTAVVTQRIRSDQVVYSKYEDLAEKHVADAELARPSAEQLQLVTDRTREALERALDGRITSAQPRKDPMDRADQVGPVYLKYDTESSQRVIRIQETAQDPLEPAKFKHKKAPARPPSPPVPVMHSPPRKLTSADQEQWRIPPCISNWKNIKGYTIAADKRLAADGRGLDDVSINDGFASLSETLYLAERNVRAELEQRQQMEAEVQLQERQVKEAQLLKLAALAKQQTQHQKRSIDERFEEDDLDAYQEREAVRQDRTRDLRRDLRMSNMGTNARKSKAERDANRDVSEAVALGKRQMGSGPMFDQRLFNQSAGMGSGFTSDDAYAAFDRPLFESKETTGIYRPPSQEVVDRYEPVSGAGKFQPDRGFAGAATTTEERRIGRDKPVQFEQGPMDSLKDAAPTARDPFNMDAHLASSTKRQRHS